MTGWLRRPRLSAGQLTLLVATALILLYNLPFWRSVLDHREVTGVRNLLFLAGLFVLLTATLNLLLSLVAVKYLQKPVLIALLITASVVAFFMNSYGVMIDSTMIQNVVETDTAEVADFLGAKLLLYVVVLGLLPSFFIARTQIRFRPWAAEIRRRILTMVLSLVAMGLVVPPFYADILFLFNENHGLRYLISPGNYIYGAIKLFSDSSKPDGRSLQPLGEDAVLGPLISAASKKTLMILVLGETARAQQFSLNGYPRETNPRLQRQEIINFTAATSCGTSTAASLPCMFTNLNRSNYRRSAARGSEGLLDVLDHAGLNVLWRDNNSGCKGICDRVDHHDMTHFDSPDYCATGECFDEVLLEGLDDYLASKTGNTFVVLHQKGSHGPAYSLRYPKRFERFTPVCTKSQLQECSLDTVVNAYDNTILYTDFFLDRVIQFLKEKSTEYNTAMLYMSDHGESLGENNVYLHGLPYLIAPPEQTRVPFLTWFSPEFQEELAIDTSCLNDRRELPVSHDNLFHSVLGLMDVQTGVYDERLDFFSPCRAVN